MTTHRTRLQRLASYAASRRFALPAVVALSLVAASGCRRAGATQGKSPGNPEASGPAATDFTTRDTDGHTVRLSDYLGKQAILLDFWSTWCQPCMAEMPHLRRLYADNRAKGFVILAVSMDGPETIAEVPSFAKRNSMTFPVLFDEDSHIASLYNPRKSAPLSVLIDKSGKVSAVREGYNPGDEEFLANDIANALGARGPSK